MAGHRREHLNEEIRHKLGLLLAREAGDPRLRTVTITDVTVAKDLSTARVTFSSYQQGADPDVLTQLLNKASGFFSHALARSLTSRKTPRLNFHYDKGFDYAQDIEQVFKKIRNEDSSREEEDEDGDE
ncbi:MAG: 30S ribosome-binding factor RbfA [Deltaproteobacteria bacterium]|nr:30S ribosome-binding factor RbfA [Deltaproteobacteria bacterium]